MIGKWNTDASSALFKVCSILGFVFCPLSLHLANGRVIMDPQLVFVAMCVYYVIMNVFVLFFVAPPPLIDLRDRRRASRAPQNSDSTASPATVPLTRGNTIPTFEWEAPSIRNYYRDAMFFPVLFLYTLLNVRGLPTDSYVSCVGILISLYLINRILLFQRSIRSYLVNPAAPMLKFNIEEIWRYNRPGGIRFLKYFLLIVLLVVSTIEIPQGGWCLVALGVYIYYDCLGFLRLVVLQEVFTYYNIAIQNVQDKVMLADNVQGILSLINNFLLGSTCIGYVLFTCLAAYLLFLLYAVVQGNFSAIAALAF